MVGTLGKKELTTFSTLIAVHDLYFSSGKFLSEDELITFLHAVENVRYNDPRLSVPKSNHWLNTILFAVNFDPKRFRSHLRMDQISFLTLVDEIKDDPIYFNNKTPTYIQIAVALNILGSFGTSASYTIVESKFGISEGTADNCVTRTIEALSNISLKWISWPKAAERKEIGSNSALRFLPKCIGYVDGSDAILYQAPSKDKEVYWSRKKKYSVQFQIVCDPSKLIRHLITGYPGSVHDAKVYSSSELAVNPKIFFSPGEFLIGDSAYSNTETVIVPYKRIAGYLPIQKRRFNKHISSQRVYVEHTIGILKGRWQSLRGLRINVNDYGGHFKVCQWIQACVILHNLLMKQDPWNQSDDFIYLEEY